MQRLKQINWHRVSWIVAIEVAIGMMIFAFFYSRGIDVGGGMDTIRYYKPFADGCLECGFIPYFAQLLLSPLILAPGGFVWPYWTMFSLSGLLLIARETKINPLIFLLTFPMIGQYWLGQIDVFVCLGALLAIRSKNPYWRGAGLTLMLVKPQIAVLAVIFLLIREERKQLLKVVFVPTAVLLISLAIYGVDWPVKWFLNAATSIPDHPWKMASEFLWPWGLVLLPLPFLFMEREEGTLVSLMVSSLAMPFFSVYSYVVFLVFESPWWVLPLSYAYRLFYPWLGLKVMKMAWLLPMGMLLVHLARRFDLPELLKRRLEGTP
ncbi:MAG: DUF2029 domain-containing protein [Anaerolineales bacterium]|nr:DUF2029 domain-containing protein [Anaerolineales bacterium]